MCCGGFESLRVNIGVLMQNDIDILYAADSSHVAVNVYLVKKNTGSRYTLVIKRLYILWNEDIRTSLNITIHHMRRSN